jgi:hypothetical protein
VPTTLIEPNRSANIDTVAEAAVVLARAIGRRDALGMRDDGGV